VRDSDAELDDFCQVSSIEHFFAANHFEGGATTRITSVDPEESTTRKGVTVTLSTRQFFWS